MKYMKPLKGLETITLGHTDAPLVSLLPGEHSLETFNLAFQNEGWLANPWTLVKFEYWFRNNEHEWKISKKTTNGAILCTVGYWE